MTKDLNSVLIEGEVIRVDDVTGGVTRAVDDMTGGENETKAGLLLASSPAPGGLMTYRIVASGKVAEQLLGFAKRGRCVRVVGKVLPDAIVAEQVEFTYRKPRYTAGP